LATPVSSLISASMMPWARTRTPLRSRSTSPSALTLRRVSSRFMLASATVVYLLSWVCNSNDVRMARWPLHCSADPLLHQVWGLNHCPR